MSNTHTSRWILGCALVLVGFSCEPIVETFEDVEDCALYTMSTGTPPTSDTSVVIGTYNIRFGMEMRPWFADACGSRVLMTESEAHHGTAVIGKALADLNVDVILLQEVDISSKRSAYIDQMTELMKAGGFRYGAYASNWKAQYIPSDGLGRVDEGDAVLSRYPISKATRIQLPLRNDLDVLTKLFYVRECLTIIVIDVPGEKDLYVFNTHLSAFATDDTKKRQLDMVHDIVMSYASDGHVVVLGGDFNLLPPNADSLDYCDEDKCPGESFHQPGDDPLHKEGSNYAPEITWMQSLYDDLIPAVALAEEAQAPYKYFSHAVDVTTPYDRHIDHLFASVAWIEGSVRVYGGPPWRSYSDHAPFVGAIRIPGAP